MATSFVFAENSSGPTIHGDPEQPTLTIHKFEQDSISEDGSADGQSIDNTYSTDNGANELGMPGQDADGEPLEGVEFTLTQTHTYDPTTNEWTEISGEAKTYTTDSNGQVFINNIDLGRYKVQETDGPDHVVLNDEEFFVDIPMTSPDGAELNYDVHIYPKNETIRGAVQLFKIDGESADHSGLADVKFGLYKADGTPIDEDLVTDDEGYIYVNALAFGDYYFQEIEALEDYMLNSEKVNFSITESGTVAIDGSQTGTVEDVELTNYAPPAIDKEVEGSKDDYETPHDEAFTYNLTILPPADIANYKEFFINDTLDERLEYAEYWDVEGIDESVLTFTETGQTLTWEVNDFAALDGVEQFTINFKAKIKPGVEIEVIGNEANIEFENEHGDDGEKETPPVYVKPVVGSISLIKQDADDETRLAGAEFELRDSEGNVIKTGTTNDQGEINWEGLEFGDYEVIETKAPSGYRLLTAPIGVTIEEGHQQVELTVDNSKTGWHLPATGGIGTVFFTILGLLLMGGALFVYMRHRKQTQAE